MSCADYLQRVPDPTEEQVREMLSGHICRCTGYTPIVEAVLDVAAALVATTANKAGGRTCLISAARFLQSVERSPHALALVDGDMQFTYAQWHRVILDVADGLRELGLCARRPAARRAAKPLGNGDAALGLPVRGHRDRRRSTGAPSPTNSTTA